MDESRIVSVHFFCSSKRNEPKKRSPEMPTSDKTGARYTGLIGAIVLSEVRTISVLPSRRNLEFLMKYQSIYWILSGLREFWVKATVLRFAARA
jgi:hypothetical protein